MIERAHDEQRRIVDFSSLFKNFWEFKKIDLIMRPSDHQKSKPVITEWFA